MIAQSVADILSRHVKLSVEGIDRMYLNVYVPKLQHEQGIVWFFRKRGESRGDQGDRDRARTKLGRYGMTGAPGTFSRAPR